MVQAHVNVFKRHRETHVSPADCYICLCCENLKQRPNEYEKKKINK